MLLLLACVSMVNFYCYEIPSPIMAQFQQRFAISDTEFNLGSAVYSLPNILLPFFGGVLIDKFGASWMLALTTAVVAVGQLVIWLATVKLSYRVYLVGRFIFGVGGITQLVTKQKILNLWFSDKRISLAFGIFWGFAIIGRAMNQLVTPVAYDQS